MTNESELGGISTLYNRIKFSIKLISIYRALTITKFISFLKKSKIGVLFLFIFRIKLFLRQLFFFLLICVALFLLLLRTVSYLIVGSYFFRFTLRAGERRRKVKALISVKKSFNKGLFKLSDIL